MENGKYPINFIGVNLTYQCNLNCFMCGQKHMNLGSKSISIDFDTLCRTIDKMIPFGLRFGVYLWGGEPFLYKRLFDLIAYLKSKKIYVIINSNGTYIHKYAQEIVDSGVDRIIVSIDGIGEKHDEIRGVPGTFDKIMEGIAKLNSIRKFRPLLTSNTVITSKNYKNLEEIIHYLIKMRFNTYEVQFPIFFTEEMGKSYEERMKDDFNVDAQYWKGFVGDYHNINVDELTAELDRIYDSVPRHFKMVPNLNHEQINIYFTKPSETIIQKKCTLPYSQVRIEPDGRLIVCPDFPDYEIGNVYDEESIPLFWEGEKIEKFRKSLNENGLLPICTKCCQLYQF